MLLSAGSVLGGGELAPVEVLSAAPAGFKIASGEGGGPPLMDSRLFGQSITSVGDLNKDGVSDLAVGAPWRGETGQSEGAVFILFMNSDGTVNTSRKLTGATTGDEFGTSVSSIGDLDGDNVYDLVVGAPGDDTGGEDRGAVYILFMNTDGTVRASTKIYSGVGDELTLSDGDHFGWSLTSLGDLDGDGLKDLAVGAVGDNTGGASTGAVYILLLNRDGSIKRSQKIANGESGGPALSPEDLFGSSVSSLRDLNGDGVVDVVVGASGDDTGGHNRGAVYVLLMNADGTVELARRIASDVGGGPTLADGDSFGTTLATLGDLNADGVTEIAVASPWVDPLGGVYILTMTADGTASGYQVLHSNVEGGPTLPYWVGFGSSVSVVEDLDGDGVNDLAVGAPSDDTDTGARGSIYVFHMNPNGTVRDGQIVASDVGGGPTLATARFFGSGVASLGDLNDDGVRDLAVGANMFTAAGNDRRAVYVLLFNEDNTVKRLQKIGSNIGGGPVLPVADGFGSSVASVGDLDGDEVVDLAVGAPWDDTEGQNRGALYILFINRDGTVKGSHRIASGVGGGPTIEDNSSLGSAVAALGDLDGDGVPDLVVGAPRDGSPSHGALFVLFMNPDGTVKMSQKVASGVGGGPPADGWFGNSVASLGDLDGDGVVDLAVGAPRDATGGYRRGAVHILFMKSDGTVKDTVKIADGTGGGPNLTDDNQFGFSVALLSDLDGDGIHDLAVGAPGDDFSGGSRGAIYLLLMNSDGTVKRWRRIGSNMGGGPQLQDDDGFGWSVASLSDVNESGGSDLAVGAPGDDTGGERRGAVHILLDVRPPSLEVSSLTPTASGFVAKFNGPMGANMLDLADVILQGSASGAVQGSVVMDQAGRTITFIKSGGVLGPDDYTVTLRSATDGFKTPDGYLLDGNRDGVAGDDFVGTFTVEVPAAGTVTLVLPDFVQGPGEAANLSPTSQPGLPLTISDGAGVRAIDLQISYDAGLLEITSASIGPKIPPGSGVVLNEETPGLAILSFFSPTDLPAGPSTFVTLETKVPNTERTRNEGGQHILDIHTVTVGDGLDNEFPVIADDALHVVAFRGDVSGDGRITASDASMVARVAALIESSFDATPLVDPILVGDISGNGRINAYDAALIARLAAGLDVANKVARPSEQMAAVQASSDDRMPPLVGRDTQSLDWHRTVVDQLMAASRTLWGDKSDEDNVFELEDGHDGLASGLRSIGEGLRTSSVSQTRRNAR